MKHKIKPLEEYLNEDFYNPFDQGEQIQMKPGHIADKGGMFKLRKEVFNINRVEYSKKKNGKYCVNAKTQYAKGEIVEIAPVLVVGLEAKAVPKLKDYIFEIDKNKGEFAVVLGYGSLYGHSDTPNITFAFNKQNKQMYFIAFRTIKAGEELTINYGKSWWEERSGLGLMTSQSPVTNPDSAAKGETDESLIQPNNQDITDKTRMGQFSQPNSKMNPSVNGIAIMGPGQS